MNWGRLLAAVMVILLAGCCAEQRPPAATRVSAAGSIEDAMKLLDHERLLIHRQILTPDLTGSEQRRGLAMERWSSRDHWRPRTVSLGKPVPLCATTFSASGTSGLAATGRPMEEMDDECERWMASFRGRR